MKKHELEIPKGYEFDCEYANQKTPDGLITSIVTFKPIKKELPKTWEEYCKITLRGNIDIYGAGGYHESLINLYKLLRLRDHYNDGWKPNYKTSSTNKYYIGCEEDEIEVGQLSYTSRILAFKNEKIRDQFLTNFRKLINEAKPLL